MQWHWIADRKSSYPHPGIANMKEAVPTRAMAFIVLTALAGAAVLVSACLHWHSNDPLKFGCYLLIAALSSRMKVELPGIESTMSVTFMFILLGVIELSLGEALLVGCAAALVQSLWNTKHRPEALKVTFNVLSVTSNGVWLTYLAYHSSAGLLRQSMPFLLLVAGLTYFLSNTVPVSAVIALCAKTSMVKTWKETYFWGLPYNLAGAGVAGIISFANRFIGWQNALIFMPIMYMIYRSYQLYLGRLEEQKKRVAVEELQVAAEKRHVEQVCALHMRTIEALAVAIEAKDHSTHEHLHRVRTYAVEIAKELGLSEEELDALRAAALLHDIGKLAVPDHIINKPGRLTPEEFEKMKIHPIVGADILERVAFPYPVAPIVRSHHEKWNGKGYPDGLKGEEIPIGARIVAAVDCLDALASDRQYRKALPLDEAMMQVAGEAGESFDPRVIEVLQRRYRALEDHAVLGLEEARIDSRSFGFKVDRGEKPGTGFQLDLNHRRGSQTDFLSSIASARQEAHTLFELSQDLGNSLSLDETLSLVAMRLRKLVPYDSIVAFIKKGDLLIPEFVSGDNFRQLSLLAIPVGTGLCGWVAQNATPIINGNPEVEQGFTQEPKMAAELRSALAVPLEGLTGLVGVLALYQSEADAFTSDHLRVLQVITSKVAMFIENALKYRQAETSATSDYLTGMPNARALSMHLEQELGRCKREHSSVAVMVCDLNGFKQVNDRYGHLAGDNVLRLFANLIRQVCRGSDYTARMGGDEFVIVAPNMTPNSVAERAILLSALAEQAGREVCGKDILSLSLGASFYPQDGLDAEQLLAEADRKMYASKQLYYEHHKTVVPDLAQYARLAIVN
jgi:diguanylate cyclase (GGDEF)-like protein/putative nucleotidyltransferase with HDIG domain